MNGSIVDGDTSSRTPLVLYQAVCLRPVSVVHRPRGLKTYRNDATNSAAAAAMPYWDITRVCIRAVTCRVIATLCKLCIVWCVYVAMGALDIH